MNVRDWKTNKKNRHRPDAWGPKGDPRSSTIESIMFVPHTREGELKRRLTRMEDSLGLRNKTKYVERVGKCIGNMLIRKDPRAGACDRGNCFICTSGGEGKCMRKGVVYMIECRLCEREGKKAAYYGESARSAYERGLGQLSALRGKDSRSPLWTHHEEVHSGEGGMDPEFRMRVISVHPNNFARQVMEGLKITNYKGDHTMNRKGEWGQNLPPILGLEDENTEGVIKGKRRQDQGKCKRDKRQRLSGDDDDSGPSGNPQPGARGSTRSTPTSSASKWPPTATHSCQTVTSKPSRKASTIPEMFRQKQECKAQSEKEKREGDMAVLLLLLLSSPVLVL